MRKIKKDIFLREIEEEANPQIYNDSKISLEHFVAIFVLVIDNLKLSKRGNNVLIEFIRAILPKNIILQNIKTYARLTKIFNFKKFDKILHVAFVAIRYGKMKNSLLQAIFECFFT